MGAKTTTNKKQQAQTQAIAVKIDNERLTARLIRSIEKGLPRVLKTPRL